MFRAYNHTSQIVNIICQLQVFPLPGSSYHSKYRTQGYTDIFFLTFYIQQSSTGAPANMTVKDYWTITIFIQTQTQKLRLILHWLRKSILYINSLIYQYYKLFNVLSQALK